MRSSTSSSASRMQIGFVCLLMGCFSVVLLVDRQRDDERSALSGFAFGRNAAVVALGDLATNRQAHAGAFVFAPAVQALENTEDAFEIFLVKPNAVVFDQKLAVPIAAVALTTQLNDRRHVFAMKLQCVADEVL